MSRGLGSTGYVAGGQAWLAIANGFLKDNFQFGLNPFHQ
jgi:hypothetical protein